MNNIVIWNSIGSSLISGVIAFVIYEFLNVIDGTGLKGGISIATIYGIVAFVLALVINLVIRSRALQTKK